MVLGRIPRSVHLLLGATAAYAIVSAWLDRDPKSEAPALPYRILDRLERDATLRSAWFGEHRRATSAPALHLDFDGPERVPAHCESEGLRAAFAEGGSIPDTGVLEVQCEAGDLGGGVELDLDCPPLLGFASFVLEARLELDGGLATDGPIRLAADLEPAFGASVADALDQPLVVRRIEAEERAATPLLEGSIEERTWLDLRIGVALDPAHPPSRCALRLWAPARLLRIDSLSVRPGTQLEGLLAGGHGRGLGVTEATRELKRLVRRGDEERTCLVLVPDTRLTVSFEMPPDAVLDYEVSALAARRAFGNTQLKIDLLRPGEFAETLSVTRVSAVDESLFRRVEVDLGRYAGEEVQLRLEVSAEESTSSPLLLLSDADLRRRSTPRPAPHLFLVTVRGEDLPNADSEALQRLRGEAREYSPFPLPGPHGEANLLHLFEHHGVLPWPPPSATAVPAPFDRVRSLAESLRRSGYETFAAPAERGQRGWLLSGFRERWLGPVGSGIDGAMRFFDEHRSWPCFLWIQLDDDVDTELRLLLDALRGRDALGQSFVVFAPETPAPDGRALPLLVRRPEPDPLEDPRPAALTPYELSPLLRELLGVGPEPEWTPLEEGGTSEVSRAPGEPPPERHWSSEFLPALWVASLDRSGPEERVR